MQNGANEMKDALKKSLYAALKAANLKKLDCISGIDLYIKKSTIAEMNFIDFINKQNERVAEKNIALILHDKDGNKLFDFENTADLDYLADILTIDLMKEIQAEFLAFNGISEEKKI